jgi:hypothetical protein
MIVPSTGAATLIKSRCIRSDLSPSQRIFTLEDSADDSAPSTRPAAADLKDMLAAAGILDAKIEKYLPILAAEDVDVTILPLASPEHLARLFSVGDCTRFQRYLVARAAAPAPSSESLPAPSPEPSPTTNYVPLVLRVDAHILAVRYLRYCCIVVFSLVSSKYFFRCVPDGVLAATQVHFGRSQEGRSQASSSFIIAPTLKT